MGKFQDKLSRRIREIEAIVKTEAEVVDYGILAK